jgi:hypothetical protein
LLASHNDAGRIRNFSGSGQIQTRGT